EGLNPFWFNWEQMGFYLIFLLYYLNEFF
ncbi:TPA: lytic murein transglycosylase, partial [Legionella pneumophila]|nr:lytic murein transglycosylase [Legionella pneumophila]